MFVDLAPVHVMTQTRLQTIAGELDGDDVDVRRFRPNILLALNNPDGRAARVAVDRRTTCRSAGLCSR